MGRKIIAHDLGTGGDKATLYDADGVCLASVFAPYETCYPGAGWHEQRPADWWDAVVSSTARLITEAGIAGRDVACLALAGQSLGAVPLDAQGELLRATTPIWSDTRAQAQVRFFFEKVDPDAWYLLTGNGFTPACYTLFKIMWYRDHEPEMFRHIHKVVGSKDYINFRLTGVLATDPSYASGSGAYDLRRGVYAAHLLDGSGLPEEILPDILPSTHVLGPLTPEASRALGLPQTVQVVCGGVDNSCMAVGARGIADGRVYTSLGSSAWIAVISREPVLNTRSKPYVFAHVIPGMFTSATSIFSAGSAFRWVRDQLCRDLLAAGEDPYDLMTGAAALSPVGANRLLFNPSLAGGNALDPSPHIRGAYIGLDLRHTRADLIRAAMEGIAFGLRLALDELRSSIPLAGEMLLAGGGSKSALWRRIFADVFDMAILKTNVGQDAASLGAMAVGAVGCGLWPGFERIDSIHQIEDVTRPVPAHVARYAAILPVYVRARECQAEIGEMLSRLDL